MFSQFFKNNNDSKESHNTKPINEIDHKNSYSSVVSSLGSAIVNMTSFSYFSTKRSSNPEQIYRGFTNLSESNDTHKSVEIMDSDKNPVIKLNISNNDKDEIFAEESNFSNEPPFTVNNSALLPIATPLSQTPDKFFGMANIEQSYLSNTNLNNNSLSSNSNTSVAESQANTFAEFNIIEEYYSADDKLYFLNQFKSHVLSEENINYIYEKLESDREQYQKFCEFFDKIINGNYDNSQDIKNLKINYDKLKEIHQILNPTFPPTLSKG